MLEIQVMDPVIAMKRVEVKTFVKIGFAFVRRLSSSCFWSSFPFGCSGVIGSPTITTLSVNPGKVDIAFRIAQCRNLVFISPRLVSSVGNSTYPGFPISTSPYAQSAYGPQPSFICDPSSLFSSFFSVFAPLHLLSLQYSLFPYLALLILRPS